MVTPTSLRKQLYDLWVSNPYITPKKACEQLKVPWDEKRKYIKKLLSEFRGYYSLGLPQKAQRLEHRVFEWENISRDLLPGNDDLGRRLKFWGWKAVDNRNGMWTFKGDPQGSVHWYKEGLVRLYLKGELQLAKAKELFCHAFRWFEPKELGKYLDVPLKETFRKWIFEIGSPMPKMDIRTFERSHGLHIFTDLSHRTSLHVGEALPFWIGEQRAINSEFHGTLELLAVQIKGHLELVKLWQEEAKGKRVTRSIMPQTVEKKNFPYQPVGDTSFSETEENDFLHEY